MTNDAKVRLEKRTNQLIFQLILSTLREAQDVKIANTFCDLPNSVVRMLSQAARRIFFIKTYQAKKILVKQF